jgi:hypothetical protein
MSKKVFLATDGEVFWPNRCARCGTKSGLTSAGASIGRVLSVRPIVAGLAVKGEILNLDYPVCEAHAKWLGLANLVTRKTTGFAILRVMIFFVGTLGVLLIPTALTRLFVPSRTGASMPVEMAAIYIVGALAMIGLIGAYMKLPLRLVKRSDDEVTIKFKNDAYAVEFARLNKDSVRTA